VLRAVNPGIGCGADHKPLDVMGRDFSVIIGEQARGGAGLRRIALLPDGNR
jgi:hypothetical protein